jgi:tetratricopeptide (TPR) repeat protein
MEPVVVEAARAAVSGCWDICWSLGVEGGWGQMARRSRPCWALWGGAVHQGDVADLALASYLHALDILNSPETDSYALALLLGNIVEVLLLTSEYDEAFSYETRRLALARQYGHALQEAQSLVATGDIQSARGQAAEARAAWTEAITLYEELDIPGAAVARQRLDAVSDDNAAATR